MKKNLAFLFTALIFLTACGGGGNNITEVGNPSKGTTATGTTQALLSLNQDFVSDVDGSSGSLIKKIIASATTQSVDCVFDSSVAEVTCQCSDGGSILESLDSSIIEDGDEVLISTNFTIVFDGCVVSACDGNTTLDGQIDGSMAGIIDLQTGDAQIALDYSTEDACSGLTSGSSNVGMSFSNAYSETSGIVDEALSGTFCVDDDEIEFSSTEDLIAQTDPEDVCSL